MQKKNTDPVSAGPDYYSENARNTSLAYDINVSVLGDRGS
jgi:hypothetical protein